MSVTRFEPFREFDRLLSMAASGTRAPLSMPMDVYRGEDGSSENAGIDVFVPREHQNRPNLSAVVWAIDEEHEHSHYFPRDCPRIVCRKTEETAEEHLQLFFNHTTAHTIITLESEWYTRIAKQKLYRYCLEAHTFELFDRTAGYYSRIKR